MSKRRIYVDTNVLVNYFTFENKLIALTPKDLKRIKRFVS